MQRREKKNDLWGVVKMKLKVQKKGRIAIAVLVYFIVAILILIIIKFPVAEKIDNDWKDVASVDAGTQILSRYESQNTSEVEKEVKSIRAAVAQRMAMGASAGENAGQVDLSSVFADAVVMGDSQAEAFEAYGILPSQSVAATIGRSIITAEEDYNKTVSRTPKQVFITYGMNDCLIYNGNTEKFISVYSDLITRLQTDIPDVQVFVCSIIVPSDAAVQKKPALAAVTDYNAALQQLAAEKGLVYIDAGALIQPDLYAPDGLHMQKSFYKSWAYYMASCAGLQ